MSDQKLSQLLVGIIEQAQDAPQREGAGAAAA